MSPAWVIAGVVIGRRLRHAWRMAPAGSIAFASPKSSTFTVPSDRTLMFAGLRSRWMMPCSCAASSASAICLAIGRASSMRNRTLRDAIGERRPLNQFHHERGDAAATSRGRRSRRCSGWLSAANVFASRSKRARRSGIRGHRSRQHLDGDLTLEVRVGRAIDLSHSAHANLGNDLIRAEASTGVIDKLT